MNYVGAPSRPAGVVSLELFPGVRGRNVRIPPAVVRCYPDVILTIVGEGDASFSRNSIAATIRRGESDGAESARTP